MGRLFENLDDGLRDWLQAQPLFFVATAPDDPSGHLNLSPKGATGTFRVLGPAAVAYVDLVGSGIETVAHLRENGRIVLMFCAFAGPPKIVRLHGRGRVVPEGDAEFAGLVDRFELSDEVRPLARSIVLVEVERIADSCGFVVPRMEYLADRDQLVRWGATRREKDGARWKRDYVAAKNAVSIDGLPGLDVTPS
jgi:Pyridoxamine 5'-phosphate oxidase